MVCLNNDWDTVLNDLFNSELYSHIRVFLKKEYFSQTIYPPMQDIYNCFRFTPYNKVKVVILGQDPYHNPGQAHGLCFSVKITPYPPSLVNIFKEIEFHMCVHIYLYQIWSSLRAQTMSASLLMLHIQHTAQNIIKDLSKNCIE